MAEIYLYIWARHIKISYTHLILTIYSEIEKLYKSELFIFFGLGGNIIRDRNYAIDKFNTQNNYKVIKNVV